MVSRAFPVAVALLAVACAHTPDQTEPAPNWGIASASTVDTFEIGGTGRNWGVKVTDTEILGIQPDFALARTDGEIRGRALGVPVVVGFHGDQGAGVYRGAPFEVYATYTPAGLHVTGIFGGAISDYELSTERINGRVGICGYDLRWNGKVYSGFRGCGQQIEAISVSLPATMAKWSDVEVAGALGMLMNVGGPIRVDRLADNSAEFRNGPVPDVALAPYYQMSYAARGGAYFGVGALRTPAGASAAAARAAGRPSGATSSAPRASGSARVSTSSH
ncbi:MAG: hypothetical protein ACXWLS_14145 [Myxococcaceae bacterium]